MAREIQDIKQQIKSELEQAFNQTASPLPRGTINVLASVLAGQSAQLELYADDRIREIFPQTASDDGLANIWADLTNRPREQATAARLIIRQTGQNGLIIQPGALGPRYTSPSGVQYSVVTGGTIVAGFVDIQVEALEGGAIGNALAGDVFALSSPLPGLNSSAIVQSVASFGQDIESIDDWRDGVTAALSRPPTGGGPGDYFKTAVSVDNIRDAFPYAGSVPGQVRVYPVASDQVDGIATNAQLAAVRDALLATSWFPIWATDTLPDGSPRLQVLVSPILTYRVTLSGLSPDTPQVRQAITSNINSYFASRRPFVVGLSTSRSNRIDGNELRAVVTNTYNQFGGGSFASLTVALESNPGSPQAFFTLPEGTRGKPNLVIS